MTKLNEVIEKFRRKLPLLNELEKTHQDAEWHAEGNVAIHTQMVMDAIVDEANKGDDTEVLIHAAAFHDIAKPLTTREREIEGVLRTISPRHAHVGRSYLANNLTAESELSNLDLDTILALVGHHHDVRKLVLDDLPRAKYARLARLCPVPLLYRLCRADMIGRICNDQESQLEQVELFKLQAQEWNCWSDDPYDGWDLEIKNAFPKRSEIFHDYALAVSQLDYENGLINSIHEAIPRAWNLAEKPYTVTLLCGPSGSGKSSWIEENRGDEVVISLDKLREVIAGKRDDQSKNGQVMQAAKEALKQALREKKDVIWDATNTRENGRSWVVDLAHDYGASSRIVTLFTPLKELLIRNQKRENPIPTKALLRQAERMEFPWLYEAHKVEVVV